MLELLLASTLTDPYRAEGILLPATAVVVGSSAGVAAGSDLVGNAAVCCIGEHDANINNKSVPHQDDNDRCITWLPDQSYGDWTHLNEIHRLSVSGSHRVELIISMD